MEMQISLKDSPYDFDHEKDYSKYGFAVKRVCDLRGNETDYKAVVNTNTGEIITFRGNKYKLLPNEVVLEASKQIASELGLKPFKLLGEATDTWRTWKSISENKTKDSTKFKKYGRKLVQEIIGEPHAMLDSSMTRMMALYTTGGVHNMDKNDKMQFGIMVKNSIDGSSHFQVMGFSFRQICTNVSWYSASRLANDRVVAGVKLRHIQNVKMDFANLKDIMDDVASRTIEMKNVYGKWMVEDVSKDTVRALGKKFPKNYLPPYMDASGRSTVLVDGVKPTAWKVYNDFTETIWHRPIEVARKEVMFNDLHSAFFKNQV